VAKRRRRKRRAPKRALSPALTRIAQRALTCTAEDIRVYAPSELDLQIAEAMLGGAFTFKDVASTIGVAPATVSNALKDPVTCGFISKQVHEMIHLRLGTIDAAMFNRACGGDVRAAQLVFKRYGEMIDLRETHVITSNTGFDPSKMSDEDLNAILASKGHVVEASFEKVEKKDDGTSESTIRVTEDSKDPEADPGDNGDDQSGGSE